MTRKKGLKRRSKKKEPNRNQFEYSNRVEKGGGTGATNGKQQQHRLMAVQLIHKGIPKKWMKFGR